MKLTIQCEKIEDRIKEQHLAERRGWTNGCYGYDGEYYYVIYSNKKRLKKNGKRKKFQRKRN